LSQNTTPVLILEDDDIDRMTVKRVFKELKVTHQLVFRSNGEDALEYLRNANNKKPCLIFMDLNMPRMNGWELLEIIQADESLSNIPVIVLTTSDSEEERKKAEQFRPIVIRYITKPLKYSESVKVLGSQLGFPTGHKEKGL